MPVGWDFFDDKFRIWLGNITFTDQIFKSLNILWYIVKINFACIRSYPLNINHKIKNIIEILWIFRFNKSTVPRDLIPVHVVLMQSKIL